MVRQLTAGACAVVAVLLAASMIDWDTTLLPDDLTLPPMWAGLVVAGLGWNPALPLRDALWGAVAKLSYARQCGAASKASSVRWPAFTPTPVSTPMARAM